jgi:prefoldin subunit 5
MPAEKQTPAQAIETLRKRHELLSKRRIEAEANLVNATEALENLRRESREKYDTDDLSKLEEMLTEMKQRNQDKLDEFRRHLDEIERNLTEVDKQST